MTVDSRGGMRRVSIRIMIALVIALVIVSGAVACIAIPAWQLIGPGPFDWHIAQPASWQGGIEALALMGLVAAGFAIDRRWALAVLILPVAFYLRRHAVDVPLLLDGFYLEIIIGLGAFLRRVLRRPSPAHSTAYLHAFVLGLLLWSVTAWTLSALDIGSIKDLRWLTLLLAIPAACGGHTPLAVWLWRRMRAEHAGGRAWIGLLAGWMLVLFARSKTVFGYDALWYGLRPEYVLDPGSSIYQALGLVSPVHYYPKLYEVFLLPVSAFGDNSVIDGMTILMLGLILIACHVLLDRLALPQRARWPVLALVATLPALANCAIGPKPDVVATLFVLLAWLASFDLIERRALAPWCWFLTCCALACLVKLTAIPYVGALGAAGFFIAAWSRWRTTARSQSTAESTPTEPGPAVAALLMVIVVGAFVTARTWLLAGVLTSGPDPLFHLWQMLGMHLREPAGSLHWQPVAHDWKDMPALALDWLLRPERLAHIVIAWVGNVWVWLALVAGLASLLLRGGAARVARMHPRLPLAALLVTGLVLAFGVRYQVRGSDGNYFLYALVPAILAAGVAAFSRLAGSPRLFAVTLACLPAFALLQASVGFVSAGWTPGTRAFDFRIHRNWQQMRTARWSRLEYAGLGHIGAWLRTLPPNARVVGYADDQASFWLPARFEYLGTIAISRPEYVDDSADFLAFLRARHIDYLILPKPEATAQFARVGKGVGDAAKRLVGDSRVRRIEDRRYYLLDLSALHQAADTDSSEH